MEIKRIEDFRKDLFEGREHDLYPEIKDGVHALIKEFPGITVREMEKKGEYNPYDIRFAVNDLEKEGKISIEGGMSKDEPYKYYPIMESLGPEMDMVDDDGDDDGDKPMESNYELNRKILEAVSDGKGCTIADLMSFTGYGKVPVVKAVRSLMRANYLIEKGGMFYLAEKN